MEPVNTLEVVKVIFFVGGPCDVNSTPLKSSFTGEIEVGLYLIFISVLNAITG